MNEELESFLAGVLDQDLLACAHSSPSDVGPLLMIQQLRVLRNIDGRLDSIYNLIMDF